MAKKNRLVWTDDVMSFLCKRCNEMYPDEPCEPSDCLMLEELDKCKTVDAVPVVRCKDCKHLIVANKEDLYAYCPKMNTCFLPFRLDTREHFCSKGERED